MSAIILARQCLYQFPSLAPFGNRDTSSADSLLSKSFLRVCIWLQTVEEILGAPWLVDPTASDHARVDATVPAFKELSRYLDEYADATQRGDSIVECLGNKILSLVDSLPDMEQLGLMGRVRGECSDDGPNYQKVIDHDWHQSSHSSPPASPTPSDLSHVSTRSLRKPPIGRHPIVGPDLVAAAEAGDSDAVARLLEQAEVRPCSHKVAQLGGDALIAATKAGHIQIVDMLSKAGISVNKRDKDGQTALFHAVRRHDKPLIDLLIDRGIRKGVRDWKGKTAWEVAIEGGDRDIILQLLDDFDCGHFPQEWDQTPVQWARNRGHKAAVAILQEVQEKQLRREMIEHLDGRRDGDAWPPIIDKDRIEELQESITRGSDWYALVNPQPQAQGSFHIDLVDTSKSNFPVRFAAHLRFPDSSLNFRAIRREARWSQKTRKGSQGKLDGPISCACVSLDEQTVAAAYGRVIKVGKGHLPWDLRIPSRPTSN